MAESDASARTSSDFEAELREANEIVYKHSLELARLKQELETANAQQESLLHFITHEVKGYLTKSEAAFAAIGDGSYGTIAPELKTMAELALADSRKGVATVTDILEAANMRRGTVAYKKESLDLKVALESSVAALKRAAEEKGLALSLSASGDAYTMLGDREKLEEHVLRNIIDNSIKYTPSGTVAVSLSREGNTAHIVVEDSGVGITSEDMARLFTEGGHGAESIKVNVHSTGYGLYIAKQVAEAHGGTIRAESGGAGKGSRFIIELPLN